MTEDRQILADDDDPVVVVTAEDSDHEDSDKDQQAALLNFTDVKSSPPSAEADKDYPA